MSYLKNSKQLFTPTTGQSVQILDGDGDIYVMVKPTSTLLALTIIMPTNPKDGQNITICSSQIITGLTITSSATINAIITTFAAINGYASWSYDSTNNMYFRVG